MIDELRALAIFATVVDAGSFRSAATLLKLSPSVVSHHIAQLESRLGAALLYRSTRRLSLTSEGEALFSSAQAMLAAAADGLNNIAYHATEPTGKINITIPAMLTKSAITNDIASFAKLYPKVMLTINFSDTQQDLIRDSIDLAIRIGNLRDSALKSKRLLMMERNIVVAPDLIRQYKSPRHPKDLQSWDWIGLKMRANKKKFINSKGKAYSLQFEPRIVVDSMDAVCQFAIAGLGIATPPAFFVANEIKNGTLVEPLPDWKAEPLPIYAVWPPNASKQSLTFRLISFLEKRGRVLT